MKLMSKSILKNRKENTPHLISKEIGKKTIDKGRRALAPKTFVLYTFFLKRCNKETIYLYRGFSFALLAEKVDYISMTTTLLWKDTESYLLKDNSR